MTVAAIRLGWGLWRDGGDGPTNHREKGQQAIMSGEAEAQDEFIVCIGCGVEFVNSVR